MMKNPRVVQAKLLVLCDVLIDDDVIGNINEQYSEVKSDKDAANQVLYAMLNPKLPEEGDLSDVKGNWDGVCKLDGRFTNIKVSTW
ncbi:hypothetical protein HQN89_02070 [Paenibacillus frigoriresistens]|uniref:hypothetical protein n=1 Tax=Paenibacillus alginolyticus TaxID=59839 RepID=UPI0015630ECE|nr:hypothetical protein [Paenibacillus frigoriresistens]NRF89825.1 hypothetical protein [Paenibacillus frigoriresistens]